MQELTPEFMLGVATWAVGWCIVSLGRCLGKRIDGMLGVFVFSAGMAIVLGSIIYIGCFCE
jgi:hypothetical protein